MIAVATVSSLPALEALAPDWDALADRSASPLVRHAWFLAAARTYAAGCELAVFTGRREGRLSAVAPMVVDRSGFAPRLRLLGFQSPEPEAFLSDDEEVLRAVCAAVLSTGKPVALPRLDAASPEWRLLAECARGRGLAVPRPGRQTYLATILKTDWAAFEAGMSGKIRSDLRRREKQLAQQGAVSFEVVSPGEHEVEAALAELIQLEAASWKGRAGTAIANRPLLKSFLTGYARIAAREGKLRFSSLRLNGAPIALQMNIEHGGRLWGLKMGTDDQWSKYAPGALSIHRLLRWAAERGLAGREHLGQAEEWQRRWPYEVRELSAFNFYPARPAAAVALGADVAGVFARAVKRRLDRRAASAKAKRMKPQAEGGSMEQAS